MEAISLYYPKKEIHVIDYGVMVHTSKIFIHNQKSYKINVCSNKNLKEHYVRILPDIKNKDSVVYSVLLLGIKKFNKGKHLHVVPKRISEKILKVTGTYIYARIKIENYDEEYNDELLQSRFSIIYFIFFALNIFSFYLIVIIYYIF